MSGERNPVMVVIEKRNGTGFYLDGLDVVKDLPPHSGFRQGYLCRVGSSYWEFCRRIAAGEIPEGADFKHCRDLAVRIRSLAPQIRHLAPQIMSFSSTDKEWQDA